VGGEGGEGNDGGAGREGGLDWRSRGRKMDKESAMSFWIWKPRPWACRSALTAQRYE